MIFSTDGELKELLSGQLEEQVVTIITESTPKCTKKSRENKEPYSEVFSKEIICRNTRKVIVGASYRDLLERFSVNQEKDDDKNRDHMELPWGEWVEGSNSLIVYKENYYLRVYMVDNFSKKYYIYSDGSLIEEDKKLRLEEFLPKNRESEGEKKVIVNNIKLSSIVGVEINNNVIERIKK